MDNHLVLSGRIVSGPDTRHSPAGIPITRFGLEHVSRRREAGMEREVRCRIGVVASGEQLQPAVAAIQRDARVRVTGFLGRTSYRSEEYRLVLHAEHIELLS